MRFSILAWVALYAGVLLAFAGCGDPSAGGAGPASGGLNSQVSWPPKVGEPYPRLTLIDRLGQPVALSAFKGKVILIEPIGMTCPACQAFAGAHRRGGYGNVTPQGGLQSIEEYFPDYAGGVSLDHPDIVYVQLLLYSMSMGAPAAEDVKAWADHFGTGTSGNTYVLAGTPELLGPASFNMIPGFQLLDRRFILRSDSTGHHPRHNLYEHLLPMVPDLLAEPGA